MSNREKCIAILDSFTDAQLVNVVAMLQAVKNTIDDALKPDIPNAETIAAMEELDSGGGHKFTGSTEQFFAELMEN